MSKVVVAEKPSVARDLARVLGAKSRRDHWLERGDGLRITWTLGHLVELKYPDDYQPELKRWRLETLPFVPERFELRPAGDAGARAQLEAVVELCRDAEELVCATDAGREGELIFRYVLEFGGLADKEFQRLWLSSMTDAEIKKAFGALRDGKDYDPLYHAARCRSEADWIVGINATRYHTVRFRSGGVLWSVGRVQTPVLALIAQREDEIRTFVAKPFHELRTRYRDVVFRRVGKDGESARFDDEASANEALGQVTDVPLAIDKVERKREKMPSPFLHDLTSLQRAMNARYGISAAQTLKIAQELYEKKLLTYPRTDSRRLPEAMYDSTARTLRSLANYDPEAVGKVDLEALPKSKRVFDDSKVTDHHAIVPTGNVPGALDESAARVFQAVLRRTCQVFLPDRVRDVTTVLARCEDHVFRARGVHEVDPGWSALDPAPAKKPAGAKTAKRGAKKGGKAEADDADDQELPEFTEGESGPHEPFLHRGETKAPRAWTENSLLGAMETAGRFVEDDELREALKARGIGTPATRASILETLLSRGYVVRDKKNLRCTDLGRYLVGIVRDPLLLSPELTGEWEAKLREIEQGARDPDEFVQGIVDWTRGLCGDEARGDADADLGPCPRCGSAVIEGREGFGCSAWESGCSFVLWKQYRGATLRRGDARHLLRRRILPTPLRLDEVGPRIVCMTTTGLLIDLEVPSRDRQGGKSGGGAKSVGARRPSPTKAGQSKAGPAKPKATKKPAGALPACPRCGAQVIEGQRGYGCSAWQSAGCRFVVWKEIQGKKVTVANVRTLIEKGKTRAAGGFRRADGSEFKGRLVLGSDGVEVEAAAE